MLNKITLWRRYRLFKHHMSKFVYLSKVKFWPYLRWSWHRCHPHTNILLMFIRMERTRHSRHTAFDTLTRTDLLRYKIRDLIILNWLYASNPLHIVKQSSQEPYSSISFRYSSLHIFYSIVNIVVYNLISFSWTHFQITPFYTELYKSNIRGAFANKFC